MTRMPTALQHLSTVLAEPGGGARVVRGRAGQIGRRAAVLIAFAHDPDAAARQSGPAAGLRLVFIEKSSQLRSHAGQVAFPGGGVDERDASSEETALREAREEVGIDPATVDLLGVLPPAQVAASGYNVTSVVAWWRRPHPLAIADPVEVAAAHQLGVVDLIDPSRRFTWVHPGGFRGPAFVIGDLFIWGFTGHLVDGLLRVAGWEQPWDTRRTAEIPERFLRRGTGDHGQ